MIGHASRDVLDEDLAHLGKCGSKPFKRGNHTPWNQRCHRPKTEKLRVIRHRELQRELPRFGRIAMRRCVQPLFENQVFDAFC